MDLVGRSWDVKVALTVITTAKIGQIRLDLSGGKKETYSSNLVVLL